MQIKNIVIILSLISFFVNVSFAQEKDHKKIKSEKKTEIKVEQSKESKTASKKIWNEVCPVMGDPVDPEVQTVEYEGKVIGFCCKSCIKKFKKDPEKYLKNLSDDGKKFIKQ